MTEATEKLVNHFLGNDTCLADALYEEWCNPNGTLNLVYARAMLKLPLAKTTLSRGLREAYGTEIFTQESLGKKETQITFEFFVEHYVPAKFANARSWVSYFDSMNCFITRKDVYGFIMEIQETKDKNY